MPCLRCLGRLKTSIVVSALVRPRRTTRTAAVLKIQAANSTKLQFCIQVVEEWFLQLRTEQENSIEQGKRGLMVLFYTLSRSIEHGGRILCRMFPKVAR